ncbi:MAG: hypothetical protein QM632_01315 [Micrococcaceae bacterium]
MLVLAIVAVALSGLGIVMMITEGDGLDDRKSELLNPDAHLMLEEVPTVAPGQLSEIDRARIEETIASRKNLQQNNNFLD